MVMVYEDRADMLSDSIVSLRVQVLRGTWQGLLGICVFEPDATSRSKAAGRNDHWKLCSGCWGQWQAGKLTMMTKSYRVAIIQQLIYVLCLAGCRSSNARVLKQYRIHVHDRRAWCFICWYLYYLPVFMFYIATYHSHDYPVSPRSTQEGEG